MAGNIKGITVEIGGDTTKLGKAITEANKHTKALQGELKGVNALLKLDPKNVTLLKQKEDLLTKSVKETEDKLKMLKSAMDGLTPEQIAEDEEGYRDLQREIIATEKKLESLKKAQGDFGSVGAQVIAEYGKNLQDLGGKVEDVGKKFMGLSATTGAVLTGSAKLASDYTDSVAKVGTVADTSKVSLEQLSDDMLALSTQTGKSANEIADATYQAISASVDTADAVNFVGTATNLAKAGFLETADAVDVLSTIINAYGLEASDAERLSGILVQTQNDGKTTVNELSASLGQVIPLASAYGVNIENLATSYANMTKNGVATAQAGTYLKSMLNELGDAGSDVSGILQEKTGKTFGQLMADGMSLGDVLDILQDSVDGDSEAFAGLWSSSEAGTGALSLMSSGVEGFNSELGKMGDVADNVSNALETLDTPSAKLEKSINALKNTGIELGSTLLTMIVPVLQTIAEKLQALFTWFSNLSPAIQKIIVIVLAVVTAIGPLLIAIGNVLTAIGTIMTWAPKIVTAVTGIMNGAKALWAVLMANPIVLIVGLIAGLVAGLIYAYNHSEKFREIVNNAFAKVKEVVGQVVEALVTFFTVTVPNAIQALGNWFTNIKTTVSTVMSNIKTTLTNVWNSIKTSVTTILNNIKTTISNIWNGIKTTVTSVINAIKSVITSVWNGIKSTTTSVWNGIKTGVSTAINGVKSTVTSVINSIKSTITSAWNAVKSTTTSVWNGIKSSISNAINGAKSTVTSVISSIKSTVKNIFSGIKPKLSLSLPHISVSGGKAPWGIAGKGSLPSFHVSWNKFGAIFKRPTIFATDQGYQGVGEAGPEAVAPIKELMGYVHNAVNTSEIVNRLASVEAILDRHLPNIGTGNAQIVLDTGVLVGETIDKIDAGLASRQLLSARGV